MLYRAAIVDVRAWVGDRWSMWVLCALAEGGTLRFSALRDNIGNISQRMLAKTLRRLQQDGLVFRFVCSARPPRVDYALTRLGNRWRCGSSSSCDGLSKISGACWTHALGGRKTNFARESEG
jgi:DNA-binding HxlR family transcriptional regulator